MIDQAASILGLSQLALWHGFVVFLRVGALVTLLPGFGETAVPLRIKLGLALAFTVPVAVAIDPFAGVPDWPDLAWLLITEPLSGALLGVSLRLFVLGLSTAGSIAAQSTSLAQIFATAGGDPQPAMAHMLVIAGLALAMMAGLHTKAVIFVILSYDMFPPARLPDAETVSTWGVGLVSKVFALGFMLAVPFVIVSVLYNLTLGVINRAMPQLMVAFVGAPVITFGGLALLMLLSPLMLQVWLAAIDGFLLVPHEVAR
ncbi:flagellar biosynthetic protein FliR [Lutimaribacter sp. EGI FJ00015]|uniref:Flagellar biosynthetic protein FliR n=1 Tax=Lutimaribacter degradans TaxID=2945989 RepID=A0ACC5ZVN0_9RHOB|nr:flagellar biosynthetic protein FliR [Lutimaribacter sp. EGI FJ00013]MCM2561905.1 flagellar biosynthetic protein FliR [Lutimaribacter sp. EGI FJ00013]MCO0613063.1 flagellar biosynthetic protein FliR [Lutimaribacter sp. EGI FJ00015]MCO0635737.1 flagellar biosynthetic protein FliR [Lutimaribacter sp. EGI FJ00014]